MIDQVWANAAIEACLRNGIDHFFLAPGSRCTPLTLAVARQTAATVIQHFDERGLAFAALGYGRATDRPGVFICTSGTAVANALPAVIESSIEKVPLLLFTADRPDELHGTGANQTIDQQNIFGDYPELFLDMPVPAEDHSPGEDLERGIAAAACGPVHFNWKFREPFTITDVRSTGFSRKEQIPAKAGTTNNPLIELRGNVLIALGNCKPFEAQQAWELSERLNCPMLADVTSGLRTGSFELPTEFALPCPDTILHIGDRIVSKTWHQWTASLPAAEVEFIHVTSTGQTVNPNRLDVTQHETDLIELTEKVTVPKTSEAFRKAWNDAAAARNEVIQRHLADATTFSEPAIALSISKQCPASHGLFIGNSTPIRDMDWFGQGLADKVRNVAANRGASGIDGLLATATGYAQGLQKPTTVVLGDLSALHDLNSLALIAKSKQPMIVVILNNQAGHIFELLPISQSGHFEQFFATPHEYDFKHAAKMFGIDYRRITEMDDFSNRYRDALSQESTIVLELMTDRRTNLKVRQQIRDGIKKCSAQN